MRRIFTLIGCALILWVIVSQLNHALTGWRIFLFAGALFVTFSALTQPLGPAIFATLFSGLVFDANAPVAFGTHMVLFALTHVALARLRDRVPRNDTISRVIVAVLANLALFLVFSFTQISRSPAPAAVWPRLLVDLACSQVFVAVVAPWYFALQSRALVLTGCERENLA